MAENVPRRLVVLCFAAVFLVFTDHALAAELVGKVIHPSNHNRGGIFLGTSYDIVRGNPHGNDLGTGGLDPGLKRTVKILKTTNTANANSDCPDQANCVPVGAVCSNTVEESLILDADDYIKSFTSSLSLEAAGTGPYLLSHTGGLSLGFERAVELMEKQEKSILFKKSVCVHGETSFKSDKDLHEIELDEYFVSSLCRLLSRHSDSDMLRFFNHWGTHAITSLTVGTKDYEQSEVDKVELIRSMQTEYSGSVFYEVGWFNLLTAAIRPSAKYTAKEYIREFHTYTNTMNFTSGTEDFPEPVKMRLRTLDSLIEDSYMPRSADVDCPALRNRESVSQLKQIVEQGLLKYPHWVGAEKNISALLRQVPAMTNWPTGLYGFLKTSQECPEGWLQGRRFHDTANAKTPDNSWSPGFETLTSSKVWPNDLYLDFCMKENENISAPRTEWPAGSYCIYKSKKSPCPYGFSGGSYYHDDDDWYNKNYANGILPDGEYGKNTEYQFCCRDDSTPFRPVFLPIEKDFILMPKRGVCQEVFGMKAEMHFIHMDCEQHWYSKCELKGNYPYGYKLADGDHELYFCHYSRMN